jgi:hypothetical protein
VGISGVRCSWVCFKMALVEGVLVTVEGWVKVKKVAAVIDPL